MEVREAGYHKSALLHNKQKKTNIPISFVIRQVYCIGGGGGRNPIVALILYLFPPSIFSFRNLFELFRMNRIFKKKGLCKRERKREVDSLLLSNKWMRNVFCYPLARHETARNAGAWPPTAATGNITTDAVVIYLVGLRCPYVLTPFFRTRSVNDVESGFPKSYCRDRRQKKQKESVPRSTFSSLELYK
jgi:hypothetical protein